MRRINVCHSRTGELILAIVGTRRLIETPFAGSLILSFDSDSDNMFHELEFTQTDIRPKPSLTFSRLTYLLRKTSSSETPIDRSLIYRFIAKRFGLIFSNKSERRGKRWTRKSEVSRSSRCDTEINSETKYSVKYCTRKQASAQNHTFD